MPRPSLHAQMQFQTNPASRNLSLEKTEWQDRLCDCYQVDEGQPPKAWRGTVQLAINHSSTGNAERRNKRYPRLQQSLTACRSETYSEPTLPARIQDLTDSLPNKKNK